MTINVAVVTSEAVILGCDSVASVTQNFLNPVPFVQQDNAGNFEVDENGKYVARFTYEDLQSVVTDAWGGVTKMFQLCGDENPVAAVTAGLAKLNDRPISALANDFSKQIAAPGSNDSVIGVVEKFVEFISGHYETHHQAIGGPPQFREDVEFLIGGFGKNDNFPSLYRVNLIDKADKRIKPLYGSGAGFEDKTGAAWAGYADGVQRLLFGFDIPLRGKVEDQVSKAINSFHKSMSDTMLRILAETLAALKSSNLPAGVNTELPPKPDVKIKWDQFILSIDFANLPLQSALDFVAYLVGLQSGKSKYVRGVPTVGGRTHIGILTKGKFEMKNEPDLIHTNLGYDRGI